MYFLQLNCTHKVWSDIENNFQGGMLQDFQKEIEKWRHLFLNNTGIYRDFLFVDCFIFHEIRFHFVLFPFLKSVHTYIYTKSSSEILILVIVKSGEWMICWYWYLRSTFYLNVMFRLKTSFRLLNSDLSIYE